MTGSQFKKIGDRIRGSVYVVPYLWVVKTVSVISVFLMAYDYFTSLKGVEKLPVNIGWAAIPFVYAALPQLLQIISAFVALSIGGETREDINLRRVMSAILIVSFLADYGTDVTYGFTYQLSDIFTASFWGDGGGVVSLIWANIVTLFVNTVGSELMFILGFGLWIELSPFAKSQMDRYKSKMKKKAEQMQGSPDFSGQGQRGGGQRPHQQQPRRGKGKPKFHTMPKPKK